MQGTKSLIAHIPFLGLRANPVIDVLAFREPYLGKICPLEEMLWAKEREANGPPLRPFLKSASIYL